MTVYSQTVKKLKLMMFRNKKRKQEQRIFFNHSQYHNPEITTLCSLSHFSFFQSEITLYVQFYTASLIHYITVFAGGGSRGVWFVESQVPD